MRRLLVLLSVFTVLLVASPAKAAPTTLSSSLPGGHKLVGYHPDNLSVRCAAYQGVQYRGNDQRPWLKVRCSGFPITVRIRNFTFRDYTYGQKFVSCKLLCVKSGTTVRMVGQWRERYADHAYGASAWVEAVIYHGPSTGGENVASYLVNGNGTVVGQPPT